MKSKGLELSEKSAIEIFTRHRLKNLPTHIRTEEHSIALKNNNKFLRVKFNQNLTFIECIQEIKKRVEKKIDK